MSEQEKRQYPQPQPREEPLIERRDREEDAIKKSITPNVEPRDPWPQPSNPRDSDDKDN